MPDLAGNESKIDVEQAFGRYPQRRVVHRVLSKIAFHPPPSSTVAEGMRFQELRLSGLSASQVRRRVEDGRLARPFHDVYLDPVTAIEREARLRALVERLPPGAAMCRQTAAALHGFGDFAPLPRGVHVVLPPDTWRPTLRGLRTHEAVLAFETVLVSGIPCTTIARTAVDLARANRRLDALPVLDGALRTGIGMDDLLSEIARHARLRGVREVRDLAPLADAGAQCRQESQLRLVAIDGGLPRPTVQHPVVDQFGFSRYYLDLAWEKYRLAAEYDGRSHAERERVSHDRERHNWLDGKGWTMRYFTDVDLYRRPSHIVSVLRNAC
jgi:hypothetical protein